MSNTNRLNSNFGNDAGEIAMYNIYVNKINDKLAEIAEALKADEPEKYIKLETISGTIKVWRFVLDKPDDTIEEPGRYFWLTEAGMLIFPISDSVKTDASKLKIVSSLDDCLPITVGYRGKESSFFLFLIYSCISCFEKRIIYKLSIDNYVD